MDYNSIKGKSVSLLIWNTQKENDAHVYLGQIVKESSGLFFINDFKGWRIGLDEEQLSRLKSVSEDMKDTFLGAEYFISLSMADLPDNNKEGFTFTGINWDKTD